MLNDINDTDPDPDADQEAEQAAEGKENELIAGANEAAADEEALNEMTPPI